jgi:hypothetical protein
MARTVLEESTCVRARRLLVSSRVIRISRSAVSESASQREQHSESSREGQTGLGARDAVGRPESTPEPHGGLLLPDASLALGRTSIARKCVVCRLVASRIARGSGACRPRIIRSSSPNSELAPFIPPLGPAPTARSSKARSGQLPLDAAVAGDYCSQTVTAQAQLVRGCIGRRAKPSAG